MGEPLPSQALQRTLVSLFGAGAHEVGEYLADKIRFHRYRSLMKILGKVREEFGETPKIPPYKFFVPFCEQASLEDVDDEIIIDMWVRLLCDASEKFSSRHMMFMRLIKEMTSKEARLLDDICRKSRGGVGAGIWEVEDAPGSVTEGAIHNFLRNWVENTQNSGGTFWSALVKKFERPGVIIRSGMFVKGVKGAWPYTHADDDDSPDLMSPLEVEYPRISFDILYGLNLLSKGTVEGVWHGEYMVEVDYYEISSLGAEFFMLCGGAKQC